jgi:hypothetical protein
MIEEEKKSDAKKMLWPTLAMMAFSTVWGFGTLLTVMFTLTVPKLYSAGY